MKKILLKMYVCCIFAISAGSAFGSKNLFNCILCGCFDKHRQLQIQTLPPESQIMEQLDDQINNQAQQEIPLTQLEMREQLRKMIEIQDTVERIVIENLSSCAEILEDNNLLQSIQQILVQIDSRLLLKVGQQSQASIEQQEIAKEKLAQLENLRTLQLIYKSVIQQLFQKQEQIQKELQQQEQEIHQQYIYTLRQRREEYRQPLPGQEQELLIKQLRNDYLIAQELMRLLLAQKISPQISLLESRRRQYEQERQQLQLEQQQLKQKLEKLKQQHLQ